jgi:hypothetical protein
MTNTTNGFDDFDTKVTAEEFYDGWTEDEADYYQDHMAAWGHRDPSPHDVTPEEE